MINGFENLIFSDEAFLHFHKFRKTTHVWSNKLIITPVIIGEGAQNGDKYHDNVCNYVCNFFKRHRKLFISHS